jgi:hypothetical protein
MTKTNEFGYAIHNDDTYSSEESLVKRNVVVSNDKIVSIAPPRIPLFSMFGNDAKSQMCSCDADYTFNMFVPISGEKIQLFFDESQWFIINNNGVMGAVTQKEKAIIPFSTHNSSESLVFCFTKTQYAYILTHIFDKKINKFVSNQKLILLGSSYGYPLSDIYTPVEKFSSYSSTISFLTKRQSNYMVSVDVKNEMFANFLYGVSTSNDFVSSFHGQLSDPNTKKIANRIYPIIERAMFFDSMDKNSAIGSAIARGRSSKKIANLLLPAKLKKGSKGPIPAWMVEQIDQVRKRISNSKTI